MISIGVAPSSALGRDLRRLHRRRQPGREVDADDGVGAVVAQAAEGLLERADRRRRRLGEHGRGIELAPERVDAQLLAVDVLAIAEADGERHDLDAELLADRLREIARAVGHDANWHAPSSSVVRPRRRPVSAYGRPGLASGTASAGVPIPEFRSPRTARGYSDHGYTPGRGRARAAGPNRRARRARRSAARPGPPTYTSAPAAPAAAVARNAVPGDESPDRARDRRGHDAPGQRGHDRPAPTSGRPPRPGHRRCAGRSTTSAPTAATRYAPLHASARPCTPRWGNSTIASTTFRPFSIALRTNGVRVSCSA